jgi:hypothetical protein
MLDSNQQTMIDCQRVSTVNPNLVMNLTYLSLHIYIYQKPMESPILCPIFDSIPWFHLDFS